MKSSIKVKKFVLFAILAVISFGFSSCSKKSDRISLENGWNYSLIDPAEVNTAFVPLDDAAIGSLNEMVPGGTGYIWLEKNFTIPESLQNKDLYVYLGKIAMADITTVNGVYIGGEGYFPPEEFSAWNVSRLYTIPKDILKDGENKLLVKIWSHGEAGISGETFIGLPDDAKVASNAIRFFNSGMYLMFSFFMLIIAGYHLLIWFQRKVEVENLTFALLNLMTTLYLSVFYIYEIPGLPVKGMSFLWFQKIFSSMMPFVFPFLVTSFINNFQNRNEKKIVYYIRLGFAILPMLPPLFAPDYPALKAMQWTMVFLVPPMIYLFVLLCTGFRKHGQATKYLLVGFSPLVLTVVIDIVVHVWLKISCPYFSALGWQLADITLLMILARRFAIARNQAEYLNKNLGRKVAERTKKLSDSYAKLEEAKNRADRDYSLAEYVQQSAYQRKVPRLGEWDIAFYFKPLKGISGDLYQFFTTGSELNGVGLFDATGHGIATGLVTMLSKNIIERKFNSGKNDNLASVMDAINTEMTKMRGEGDTFVSGVLLRINEERVEYVNAGHPKVFIRRSSNGIVETFENNSGGVLGVEGFNPVFRAVSSSLESGDAILLYTDALYSSRNTAGAEFGIERITKAFAACGAGVAQDKLNSILSIFNFYTKDVPMKDDLTVIVLQRK